jgi:predicted permease
MDPQRWWSEVSFVARRLFGRARAERELDEEIRAHLELEIEQNVEGGMSHEEARLRALRAFGSVALAAEESRAAWRLRPAETLWQDLRFGARVLAKSRASTAVAVVSLALGIGASSAVFSFVDALLLRPLAVPEPDRLVTLARGDGLAPPLSYPDYTALRDQNDALAGLAAFAPTPFSFGRNGANEVVLGEVVSGNYFDVLGVTPALGRTFAPDEDREAGAHPVVVLSHRFWLSRLGGDPGALGRSVVLNGRPFTIVGIAPPGFDGATVPARASLWVPMAMEREAMPGAPPDLLADRRARFFAGVGRLRSGTSFDPAQAALAAVALRLDEADPDTAGEVGRALWLMRPTGVYLPHLRKGVALASGVLTAIVATVLLIACLNAANILLARATARSKEIALRLAVGASRWRLVRQLLTESVMLALLGAAAGLLFAWWINAAFMAFKPPIPPPFTFSADLRLDVRTFVFTAVLAAAAGIAFGLVPALQTSRPDLVTALKADAGSDRRWRPSKLRSALVIMQVAVSLVLLVSAGLFIRSLERTENLDPGIRTAGRVAVPVDLELQGYDEAKGRAFYRAALDRIGALPFVRCASMTSSLPMGFRNQGIPFRVAGREPAPGEQAPFAGYFAVGVRSFDTMGTPLLAGRDFTDADAAGAPRVCIVNQALASRFFPEEGALGRRIAVGPSDAETREIVGIAGDVAMQTPGEPRQPIIYEPLAQAYTPAAVLVVDADGDGAQVISAVRRELLEIDGNLPLEQAATLEEHVGLALWLPRMAAAVLSALGLVGLLLTLSGIYGVMSYWVGQRTREIGVRMALGAKAADVTRLVVLEGMRLTLVGAAVGVPLAWAATRLLSAVVPGLGPTDATTFGAVIGLFTVVALAACYIPARRAARVDPLVALRVE